MLERIIPPGFEPAMLPEPRSRGAQLTQRYCVQCHNLANPAMHDAARWPSVVARMVPRMEGKGNMGKLMSEMMAGVESPSPQDTRAITAYLRKHAQRPLDPDKIPAVNAPSAEPFRVACGQCHVLPDPRRHRAKEWPAVVARMQKNMEWMNRVVGSRPVPVELQLKIEDINAFLMRHARRQTPMPRKIVDLSIYLENEVVSDPPPFAPKITYMDHQTTFPQMAPFFPGLKKEDLPDGAAWAVEKVELITHNGTHLDAPYHFHPTMNKGERAIAIDEVDLEWCFQPGVKLDFRHFPDGYVVTADDVEAELRKIKHALKPLEIVVVNTRAGSRYGHDDYVSAGCGMGYAATMYLLERGVRLTGTDAWSWDAPFVYTAEKYKATKDASLIWEGHKAGRDIGYCHLEKLHNLEAIPADGFVVACFPHKIRGASAGWTRAVAIFDDLLLESFRRDGTGKTQKNVVPAKAGT